MDEVKKAQHVNGWRELWSSANGRMKSVYIAQLIFTVSVAVFTLGNALYYDDGEWNSKTAEAIGALGAAVAFIALFYTVIGGWRSIVVSATLLVTVVLTLVSIVSIINIDGDLAPKIGASVIAMFLVLALNYGGYCLIRFFYRIKKPEKVVLINGEEIPESKVIDPEFEEFINHPITEAFVGDNFEHYKKIWSEDLRHYSKVGFHENWLAIFTTVPTWLAYRKMYKTAFAYTGLLCGCVIFSGFLGVENDTGAFVGVNLAFSMFSKSLYYNHVKEFFEQNKYANVAGVVIRHAKEHGGTSVKHAILMTLFTFAAVISTNELAFLLFNN